MAESAAEESQTERDDESLIGTRVGKYEIVGLIGRGGMGHVYEALNTTIGKRVAIKFVDKDIAKNRDAVARFQREAQAASAVESAHIVEIFDSGETDDKLPYIVMELLRGEDLGHRIRCLGRLEIPEALHIVAQILRGLHRAHEVGIIHRDLKPDNVFLVDRDDDPNFAKVLDFGISKMQRRGDKPTKTITREGTVLGTPFYMAPEQAQAMSDVDGRADLWSVGAILYEMLTGRAPHNGGTYEQVIINICTKDAEDVRAHNPAVSDALAQCVTKALAREREDRFESAAEFLQAVADASEGQINPRMGRSSKSGNSFAPRSNPISSARGSGRGSGPTPDELAPTVDAAQQPSRVGWATNPLRDANRERRIFVLVAAASVALGSTGAFLYFSGDGDAPPASAAVPQASVALSCNADGATFSVDGRVLDGDMLIGEPGATFMVDVRADGFEHRSVPVALDPSKPEAFIELDPSGPDVEPADATGDLAAIADAEASASANASASAAPPPPPPPAAPPAAPPISPPPPPPGSGVASGLQLKTGD